MALKFFTLQCSCDPVRPHPLVARDSHNKGEAIIMYKSRALAELRAADMSDENGVRPTVGEYVVDNA